MKNKKKILILVENLPLPFDRRVWMEATTLKNAGYQVSIISPNSKDYPGLYEEIKGINIYRYPLPSFESVIGHFLEYFIAFFATLFLTFVVWLKDGFYIIQSANPPDFFFIIAWFYKIFGKKFVFDHHDLMPEICDSRWKGWKYVLTYNLSIISEKLTFKTADQVISTNESYRDIAINRGGMKPENVTVVRSGPRISEFTILPCENTLKKGRTYLVCYLGVMGPNDGIEYLLESIELIINRYKRTDIHFILIGSGDCQPKLKQQSISMGLSDFVDFPGRLPDLEVRRIISTADLGVAPDPKDPLNNLSTMNKIIEYMALATPLVSFDLKEARVSAEDAAVFAEANDVEDFAKKIIELLEDPARRKRMGEFGRKRFKEALAWEHQQEKLLKLYQRI